MKRIQYTLIFFLVVLVTTAIFRGEFSEESIIGAAQAAVGLFFGYGAGEKFGGKDD